MKRNPKLMYETAATIYLHIVFFYFAYKNKEKQNQTNTLIVFEL